VNRDHIVVLTREVRVKLGAVTGNDNNFLDTRGSQSFNRLRDYWLFA
jgi:hypothetical protein